MFKNRNKKIMLHIAGVLTFLAITGYSIYHTPVPLSSLRGYWTILIIVAALISLMVQAGQLHLFLRNENRSGSLLWILWFISEKAWLNSVFPAKAGTIGTAPILIRQKEIKLNSYVKFMLAIIVITVASTAACTILFYSNSTTEKLLGFLIFPASAFISNKVYKLNKAPLLFLYILSLIAISSLSLAIFASLNLIAYSPTIMNSLPMGLILNGLSIASITPGNFGVREAAITTYGTFTTIPFSILIQASSIFVITRLATAGAIAQALRGAIRFG